MFPAECWMYGPPKEPGGPRQVWHTFLDYISHGIHLHKSLSVFNSYIAPVYLVKSLNEENRNSVSVPLSRKLKGYAVSPQMQTTGRRPPPISTWIFFVALRRQQIVGVVAFEKSSGGAMDREPRSKEARQCKSHVWEKAN